MNKDPRDREWREMKGKVEKNLCPELGMDLFRGELFSGEYSSDLQVFGKDVFLRNMLQRILAVDLHFKDRMAPVFIIVPSSQRDLLIKVNRILVKEAPEEAGAFFLYDKKRPEDSVNPGRFISLLDPDGIEWISGAKRQIHLFAVLREDEERPLSNPMVFRLRKAIRERFPSKSINAPRPRYPLIYLFHPEDMGSYENVCKWIGDLMEHCLFRIFLRETHSFIEPSQTSLIYGPDIYSAETYEKMQRYFHKRNGRKRDRKYIFWDDRETSMRSKSLELFASEIPVSQTGFAFYKNAASQRYNHVWFYPARQSLGDLPYKPPHSSFLNAPDNSKVKTVLKEPVKPKDPLAEIMNDLRPGKKNP
jgi:hypothetical protein